MYINDRYFYLLKIHVKAITLTILPFNQLEDITSHSRTTRVTKWLQISHHIAELHV